MKHKYILLTTAIALMLTACGTTNEQFPPTDNEEIIPPIIPTDPAKEKQKERIAQIRQYMFGDTLKTNEDEPRDPKIVGGPVGSWYHAILTPAMKNTVKSVWTALKTHGFSGYDDSVLEGKTRYDVNTHVVGWKSAFLDLRENERAFHSLLINNLGAQLGAVSSSDFYNALLGLKFGGQYIIEIKDSQQMVRPFKEKEYKNFTRAKEMYALADAWRDGESGYTYKLPERLPTDTIIPEATLKEWNQIFIDALKEDPFFKQFFEAPLAPTDASGSASALAALKGKSGLDSTQLMMNGVSGSHVDLGLPVYVQLKGSMDQGKSTAGMTGLVAYKLGNSVLGVIQSYANSGTGFNSDSRQLESSIIAAHSFGLMFVEGQFGSISASDVNFKNWSGVRSQLRLGIDTPYGAPFVQLTHRDFGSTSDTAGYVGFEIANTEFKADTYAFSTSLLTKVGHHSVHGSTGSIDWTAALNLNSGVAFSTNLTLGSTFESKAAFNLSLDR